MKPPRKSPNLTEKLASALLELERLRGNPIDREHAKLMTASQIVSLWQFDHAAGYACDDIGNHPTVLTPMLIADHREKTAKFDVPRIRKGDRLQPKHIEFQKRVLAKAGQGEAPPKRKSSISSRPFNTKGAKLRSRNNLRKRVTA